MIASLLYLFAFVFVLSLVVVIHEGGHFFVARACGVKVTDFSIGFGKELWHRVDKRGTRWKICLIPLGGYVKMLGDEDAASAKSSTQKVAQDEVKYTFLAQPLWKRACIIVAGPAMNYLFAIVVLTGIIFSLGEVAVPPVIGSVKEGSAASEAGLQQGDRFVKMNGQDVKEYTDILRIVRLTEFEKPLDIVFMRGDVENRLSLTPKYEEGSEFPMIGVMASPELIAINKDVHLGQAFVLSVKEVYQMTADTVTYLGQILFKNRSPKDMRGPLGIAEASGDALKSGFLSLIMFIVQISVAIGFMNLLPVPVLDGGHLAFYAIEAVRGKPLSERAQNVFLMVGISLLFLLFAYTMFLDVPRIMQRILG